MASSKALHEALRVNPAFECLSALSVILDLANGLAEDKSVLAATFAWELAGDAGLADDERWAATLSALLRHLGCTAYASVEADVAGDDIALRAGLHRRDASKALDAMKAVSGAQSGVFAKSRSVVAFAANGPRMKAELTAEACGAARLLSERMQLGPAVTRALDEVFERHDGSGSPHGWHGAQLSVAGSVATVAHVATVFTLEGGVGLAQQQLDARAGTMLEPKLAARAKALVAAMAPSPAEYLGQRHEALLGFATKRPLSTTLDDVAEAFGDFSDLQAPHARGHSREVAALARLTAQSLKLSTEEQQTLTRAAHLHDLGQVAVPTSIWTTPRVHRPSERERARAHVFFTERVLAAAPALSAVAKVAGSHHERLDGSGYHRGSAGGALQRPARVLAVADVLSALTKDRPHRPAKTGAAAAAEVRAMVKAGALDGEVVEAALAAMGERRVKAPSSQLSERELEVLRHVARGKTNKEIASALGLSARTVQHHTIHIYEKLGVDTRAGAAMVASQRGLLE
ncbi:MAG: HD domain-containing protein [Archangiaceae bacterium]|nr:HD domain-containing protein [Archangiaceae bacterium]